VARFKLCEKTPLVRFVLNRCHITDRFFGNSTKTRTNWVLILGHVIKLWLFYSRFLQIVQASYVPDTILDRCTCRHCRTKARLFLQIRDNWWVTSLSHFLFSLMVSYFLRTWSVIRDIFIQGLETNVLFSEGELGDLNLRVGTCDLFSGTIPNVFFLFMTGGGCGGGSPPQCENMFSQLHENPMFSQLH
jgi:hypothetical protein